MLEKGKISSIQMEFIMIPSIIATGILSIPALAGRIAKHDMWMTPIVGSIIGFITVYIAWKLFQLYPSLTPIQYSEKILGKVLGRLLGTFFIFFYFHNTGLIIRQYTDFITSNVMKETPPIVFSISFLFVSALAVRGGIEVIARTAIICTTIYLVALLSLFLLIKDIKISYVLPVLENGFLPVVKGGMVHGAWFSEFFLLAFLFPFVNRVNNKTLKSGWKTTLFVMLIFIYVNFFVLTYLEKSAVNQLYPVYSIVRSISVLGFFENFEVLITAAWVLGNFVKVSLFLYVTSLGLAQLLRLSDYRLIVFPISLLVILISNWGLPNIAVFIDFMTHIQPIYFIIVQTMIPLMLLIIAYVRKHMGWEK